MIFNTFIMNKKILLISLGVLSFATAMQARSRSVEEAKQVAADFYQNQSGLRAASAPELTLVYSGSESGLRSSASEAPFYVFNIGSADGFVMVSGDDRVAPVIGYSLTSAFNPDNMPSNLRGWLEGYEKQIAYARTLPDKPYEAPETRAGDAVEPLITTQWDQSGPYNNECPDIDGEKALTGCVATAMAQIMNYHEYPASAKGTGSYIIGNDTTSSIDMTQYTFDWANMTDTYGKDATEAQNAAVAKLMAACGAGVQMQYGTIASSAYDSDVAESLIRNMGYDENVSFVLRDMYSNKEWINLMKSELQAGRPILYGGSSASLGGHAFVCDGYAPNDFFHINWGWSGSYDEFYKLDLLYPNDSGEYGLGGFSYQQDAVIGIQPPTDNSVAHDGLFIHSFTPEETIMEQGDTLKVSFTFRFVVAIPQDIEFGMRFQSENKTITYSFGTSFADPLYYYTLSNPIYNFNLEAGTYDLKFVYKKEGDTDWRDAEVSYRSMVRDVRVEATEEHIAWTYEEPNLNASFGGHYYNTQTGAWTGASYTIQNVGDKEYHPQLGFWIESETMDTVVYNCTQVYLEPGEEKECSAFWNFDLKPGTYTIRLFAYDDINPYDGESHLIWIISEVEVKVDDPTSNETISTNDFSIRVYSDRIAVQSASPVRQIELFDIAGRLAGNIRAANELPVDGVAAGVYIVRVTTDEGVQTEKVILHR